MREKKGFTMVEMLVVIAIIGILSLIVIPNIINYMKDAKERYNNELKEQLVVSGKNYYAQNQDKLPKKSYLEKNIEKHSLVTLSELQSRNFVTNEFIDADDRPCKNSYVYVTKPVGEESDEYHGCLLCQREGEEEVNHSSEDKYCDITDFDDSTRPTCKASITNESSKKGNIVYNPEEVKLSEVADIDGEINQIWIYNITTKDETVIEVKGKTIEEIKNINIAKYFTKDKKGNVKEGEYTIYVRDKGGNFSSESCNKDNRIIIDKTAPECNLNYNDDCGSGVGLKIEIKDNVSGGAAIESVIDDNSSKTGTNYTKQSLIKPLYDGRYYGHVKDEAGNEGICHEDVKIKMCQGDKPYCRLFSGSTVYEVAKRDQILTHKVECYVYGGDKNDIDGSKVTPKNDLVDVTGVEKDSKSNDNKDNKVVVEVDSKVNNKGDGDENLDINPGFIKDGDNTNDKTEAQEKDFKVDITAPTVTLTNSSGGNWTKEKVVLTITATDETSGIGYVEYSFDNKTWTKKTDDFDTQTNNKITWTPEYNTERTDTFYIRVTDKAGNTSPVQQTNIKIDRTGPTVTLTNSSGGSWTNQKIVLTITGQDEKSGIKNVEYKVDGATSWTAKTSDFDSQTSTKITWTPEYTADRNTTFYVRATDAAGNVSTTSPSTPLKIDTKEPTCSYSGESTTWQKADRKITKGCTDTGGSGCKTAATTATYSTTTKTATLSYTISDNAGNSKTCSKTVNVYVDKTGPTCGKAVATTAPTSLATYTNKDRTVRQPCTDSHSGCAKTNYDTKYTTGTTGSVTISDKVGNTTKCNYNINIDKSNPTCSVTKTVTGESGVTVSVTCKDTGGSEVNKCNSTSVAVKGLKEGKKTYTVTDKAGNSGTCSTTVTKETQYKSKSRTASAMAGYYTSGYCNGKSSGTFYQDTSNKTTYYTKTTYTGSCTGYSYSWQYVKTVTTSGYGSCDDAYPIKQGPCLKDSGGKLYRAGCTCTGCYKGSLSGGACHCNGSCGNGKTYCNKYQTKLYTCKKGSCTGYGNYTSSSTTSSSCTKSGTKGSSKTYVTCSGFTVYKCYSLNSWTYGSWTTTKPSSTYFNNSSPQTLKSGLYDTRTVYK